MGCCLRTGAKRATNRPAAVLSERLCRLAFDRRLAIYKAHFRCLSSQRWVSTAHLIQQGDAGPQCGGRARAERSGQSEHESTEENQVAFGRHRCRRGSRRRHGRLVVANQYVSTGTSGSGTAGPLRANDHPANDSPVASMSWRHARDSRNCGQPPGRLSAYGTGRSRRGSDITDAFSSRSVTDRLLYLRPGQLKHHERRAH